MYYDAGAPASAPAAASSTPPLMSPTTPASDCPLNCPPNAEIQEKQPWYEHTETSMRVNNANQLNYINDLNTLLPISGEGYGRLKELSPTHYIDAQIKPVFRNIEEALIEEIDKHTLVVGCVAWLTSEPILEALQGKAVQFVLQQEDWLRPDSDDWTMQKQRRLYDKLTGIQNYIANVNNASCHIIAPIYLCGKPKTKMRSQPRMHHKFILFGNEHNSYFPELDDMRTYSNFDLVWTGSYNVTKNAKHSLENGLFIKSKEIVEVYRQEWRQVLLSSVRVQDKWWDKEYAWSNDEDEGLRDGT